VVTSPLATLHHIDSQGAARASDLRRQPGLHRLL